MPRVTPSDDDPPPQPPVQPELEECCHSGCTQCVFDLYDDALERYRIALAAWQERRADQQAAAAKPRRAKTATSAKTPRGTPRPRR